MIFNTAQITVKLNPAWDVLKIMWKNWTIIVMQLEYLTAVEKHLASNEKCSSTSITYCYDITMKFESLHIFFNTSHRTVKLDTS